MLLVSEPDLGMQEKAALAAVIADAQRLGRLLSRNFSAPTSRPSSRREPRSRRNGNSGLA